MINNTVLSGIQNIYRRIGIYTSSSVFLLFLLGSLVRATGSGMGCPDWPKCFGQLAPPLHAADLPENYQEIFLKKRVAKLERFTATLDKLGMGERAEAIRKDPKMYEPEVFHPVKAWIEYINRLFGVLSGLLAVAMGFLILWKPKVLGRARGWFLFGLVFLLLNAWLGSLVVTTNLLPGMVSLHFVLAFVCLFGFIKSVDVISPVIPRFTVVKNDYTWFWLLILFVVILGTWSREQVDFLKQFGSISMSEGTDPRILNVEAMDIWFAIHRYMPLLILGFLGYRWWQHKALRALVKPYQWLFGLVFAQIALGIIHIRFVVPEWAQVAHVLAGSTLLTVSFLLFLSSKKTT
jgi:cytochrome c oxidase assembly protein subunit 15